MGLRATSAVLAAAWAVGVPARAQDVTASPTPYHVDWALDLAVTGGATALWLITPLVAHEVVRPTCPCNRSDLPPFDRYPVGRQSRVADQLSNVAEGALTAVPVLLDALDIHRAGGGWLELATDLTVMAQVVAVNGAVNQLVKVGVRRPRPVVYDVEAGNPEVADPGNYLSFYSGHTCTAFAAGMFYATTFALRHPDSRARVPVYVAALTAGAGVGLLRVLAGQHFPTDVIAGAAVGGTLGVLLPRLHHRGATVLVAPSAAGAALMLTGRI
jgi:membrane-associated phospholipid phosphatase